MLDGQLAVAQLPSTHVSLRMYKMTLACSHLKIISHVSIVRTARQSWCSDPMPAMATTKKTMYTA